MKRNIVEVDTFLRMYELDDELKRNYLQINGLDSMQRHELDTLNSLFKQLSPFLKSSQKNGYFLDKSIKCGIQEQFDVLRFSGDSVINVELKYKIPKYGISGIFNQLQRHEHLLKNICETVQTFCYIFDSNMLYQLTDSKKLKEIRIADLATSICDDYVEENLLEHIDSSNILISPYSEPQKFIESKYFLSDEQRDIVEKLISDNNQLNAITGGPGTDKSLVLFELAKRYLEQGNKVLFIFSAKFEDSDFDSYFSFDFKAIKDVEINHVIPKYDIILVDEAQRLRESQIKSLLDSKKIIFAVDHRQVLRFTEEKLSIEKLLRGNEAVTLYELTEKVRADKELSSFIQNFFDCHSKVQAEEFTKVNAVYFDSDIDARTFIEKMALNENYVPIELTEYKKYNWSKPSEIYRTRISNCSKNQFEVIGREYNKVLVVIDDKAKYDENGKLIIPQKNYDYIELNGLFEAMTRVRENLLLVFVRNKNLFIKTGELLNLKSSTKERENIRNLLTVSQKLEENLIAEGTLKKNEYVVTNRKIRAQMGNFIKK